MKSIFLLYEFKQNNSMHGFNDQLYKHEFQIYNKLLLDVMQ